MIPTVIDFPVLVPKNFNAVFIFCLFLFLAVDSLYFGRDFLILITLAALLTMLFVRFSNYLESKGIKMGWSALICVLLLVTLVAGAFTLLSMQLSNLADNMDGNKKRLLNMVDQMASKLAKLVCAYLRYLSA